MNDNTKYKYYSEVKIYEKDGVKLIEKTYPFSYLSRSEIEELRQKMLLHRNAFIEMHVPIPELFTIDIHKTGDVFNLNVIEKFEGLDFVDVVDDANFEMYMDRMLADIYKPLMKSTSEQYLKAGIDTVVRNYVYRTHEGEFCYVDFMPPKVFYKGSYTQEVPEMAGPFKDIRMLCHNDRAGVMYVLYINFARVYPGKRRTILSKIEQFLDGISEPGLKKYIVESPFYRLSDPHKAVDVISNMKSWEGSNYYILREAGSIAAEYNGKFRPLLEDFCKLTHHENDPRSKDYGRLPEDRFIQAKHKLIEALS